MLRLAEKIEQFNCAVGKGLAWLCLAMVVTTSFVVIERYWFAGGSIRLQESITVMHAIVFMLTAAYTLAAGDHVRVDIFYSSLSPRGKAAIDLAGTLLLLLPFCLFVLWASWDFVSVSWQIREASQEAGGLPYPILPLTKSCIPLSMLLLLLQGGVIMIRSIATLRGSSAQSRGEP